MRFFIWATSPRVKRTRQIAGKFCYIVVFYGTPGIAYVELFLNGSINSWLGLTLAGLVWFLALAYSGQTRRLIAARKAIKGLTRGEPIVSYRVWPPDRGSDDAS